MIRLPGQMALVLGPTKTLKDLVGGAVVVEWCAEFDCGISSTWYYDIVADDDKSALSRNLALLFAFAALHLRLLGAFARASARFVRRRDAIAGDRNGSALAQCESEG